VPSENPACEPTEDPSRVPMGRDAAMRFSTGIPGWLTDEQAALLAEHASRLPGGAAGVVVEIGSHEGRSTVVLGASVPRGARVVAIDPFPSDWRYGSAATERRLRLNLLEAGLEGTVDVVVAQSNEVLGAWSCPIDLVYVDGKHDVRSTISDLAWSRHLPPGGRVLVHDAFSSVGVTLALLWRVLPSSDLRYLGRAGSLAVLERARPGWSDRARVVRQLPWWARNVGIKVLLRLHLRRVARLTGHQDEFDPY
jgi:predicted O-methyltransferase YrrM